MGWDDGTDGIKNMRYHKYRANTKAAKMSVREQGYVIKEKRLSRDAEPSPWRTFLCIKFDAALPCNWREASSPQSNGPISSLPHSFDYRVPYRTF